MRKRITFATVGVLLMGGLAALGVAVADTSSPSERALERSNRLTTMRMTESLNAGPYLDTYPEIKDHAEEFAENLPLPSDDSLDDVGYFAAANQGGTSAALLEFTMQYNVRCDWYRVALNNRSDQVAREIVNEVPRWAAFRDARLGPVSSRSQEIATALSQGNMEPLRAEVSGPACNPAAALVPYPG
jgi:hypothetical protein